MSKKTHIATLMAAFADEPGSSNRKAATNATDTGDDEEDTWHTLNVADGANDVVRVDMEFVGNAGRDGIESPEDVGIARLSLSTEPTFGVATRSRRTEEVIYYSETLDRGFVFTPLGKSQDVPGADEYFCSLCPPKERCRVYVRDGVFVGVDPAVGTTPHTCVNFGKGQRGRRTGLPPSCDKLRTGTSNSPRVRGTSANGGSTRRVCVEGSALETNLRKIIVKMAPFTCLKGVSFDKHVEDAGSEHTQRSMPAAQPEAQLPEVVDRKVRSTDMHAAGAEDVAAPSTETGPVPRKRPKVTVTVHVPKPKREPIDYDSDVEILDVKPPKIPCAYSDFLQSSSPSDVGTSRGMYNTAMSAQNPNPDRQVRMSFGRAMPSADDPTVVPYRSKLHDTTFKFREVSAIMDPVTGKTRRAYQCMGCKAAAKKHEVDVSIPLVKVVDSTFVDINPDRPQENDHLCVRDGWQ